MRIGFDAKRYFHNKTGLGNFSRELIHALARTYPSDEFVLFDSNPFDLKTEFPNLEVYKPKRKFLYRRFGIASDVKAAGIDVFHGLSNELPFGLSGKELLKVVTIHDVIFRRYPNHYPWVDRKIYHLKTAHALRSANTVVATSEATKSDLEKYYSGTQTEIKVIYQPVNPDYYTKSLTDKAGSSPYFLYVSTFSDRKNHGALIQAFAKISKQTEWDLVLIGTRGNTLDKMKRFVIQEKLDHRIQIYSDLKHDELVGWMKRASAFVYPSLFEGFGIPLAEAAVCGLPMAVSNIPVFKELAENAAIYFHPNKTDEIAEAMLRLTRREETMRMTEYRKVLVDKINPDRIASHYMEVYKAGKS